MKVLAIRGEKLASLEEPFAVEFASGPLARAGLIVVTGPTGSGKSTLLDAMCLALFGETPRLRGGGGPMIGLAEEDEALLCSENDCRNILRRGAANGFAEVDFLAGDGKRYRATYRLRRARNKAGGKIQAPELSLLDLESGQPIHKSRMTDTLEFIQKLIGLSFAQFRRSVLLAQGDFAAFLKAKEGERSLLLEQMTGTELYGRISSQSFLRARDEQSRLSQLMEAAPVNLLPDDERAAKSERVAKLDGEIAAFKRQSGELADEREWRKRLAECELAAAQAEADHSRVKARLDAFAADAKELTDVEQAEQFRRVLEAADAFAAQARTAELDLKTKAEREAAATQSVALAEDAHRQALEASARIEERSRHMQPTLDRARALDATLEGAAREESAARKAAEAANESAYKTAGELAACTQLRAACAARLEALAKWLTAHQSLERPSADWTHCRHRIQEVERNQRDWTHQTRALKRLEGEIEIAKKKQTLAHDAEACSRELAKQADDALQRARGRADAAPLELRRAAREAAAAAMKRFEEMFRLLTAASRRRRRRFARRPRPKPRRPRLSRTSMK